MSFIYFLPVNKKLRVEKYKTILDLAFENDIVIEHNCGGNCACTACIVKIEKGLKYFNDISENEKYQLKKAKKRKKGYRLACRSYLIKDSDEDIIINLS